VTAGADGAAPPHLTAAAAELTALVASFDELDLNGTPQITGSTLTARLILDLSSIAAGPGGLRVQPVETVVLTADEYFPEVPPRAIVEHRRWIGYPHVLQGDRLCLFLDPDRQWNPGTAMTGAVERLWGWFTEAIGGRFDARSSLFHALGGVHHHRVGDPVLTVRDAPADLRPGIIKITVARRTDSRFDVTGWRQDPGDGETAGLAIVTHDPLTLGLGGDLATLLHRIDRPVRTDTERHLPRHGFPSAEHTAFRIRQAARRLPAGEPLRIVVAARNPALAGPGAYDLAAVVLEPDVLNAAGLAPGASDGDLTAAGLAFMRPDDTRPAVSTRRDDGRPVSWFEGKWIRLFGCGALGSWIGEHLVRAGAARVSAWDPAEVSRGLLVRQNFTEADVGTNKAAALVARLRAVSDTVHAEVAPPPLHILGSAGERPDLIIDASVSVQMSTQLERWAAHGDECPALAQVATDNHTASLGAVTVAPAGGGVSMAAAQQALIDAVEADAALEDFGRFWDPSDDGLFAPARGCSVPTFHGSAADAAAIAASAVSVLGPALAANLAGGYLLALPYTAASVPPLTWVDLEPGP
jgi:hypothetical protein